MIKKLIDRLKSWKTTTIGVIALLGLIYKGYTSGGFEVSDFLILAAGVGFISAKEKSKS
jgi:hypothetical protein